MSLSTQALRPYSRYEERAEALLQRQSQAPPALTPEWTAGFSLTETLIALVVLSFGLLAAGPLMFASIASATLARSKTIATVALQDQLGELEALYRQHPDAEVFALGEHGPRQIQVLNPMDGKIWYRYNMSWVVRSISDPRPGKMLSGRLVTATATPITHAGTSNSQPYENKIVSVTAIFTREAS